MSLTSKDITKIAHLARLHMSDEEIQAFSAQLTHIFDFVEEMSKINTDHIAGTPYSHTAQRKREDIVTEHNQRDAFQAIAPKVEAGLYLVPKVIEST